MNRDAEAVRSLLAQRVDVNAGQLDGATALHWAVRWDDLATADLLIAAGADVEASNRNGATPMSLASVNGSAAMLEKLLEAGADPDGDFFANGETAIMMTARTGNVNAVRVLTRARGEREPERDPARHDGADVGGGGEPYGRC